MMLTQEQLWTKAERDGICDQVLLSQTKPNELHRAKQTLAAVIEKLIDEHYAPSERRGRNPGPAHNGCETCRLLQMLEGGE